jgi:hypothetical protein
MVRDVKTKIEPEKLANKKSKSRQSEGRGDMTERALSAIVLDYFCPFLFRQRTHARGGRWGWKKTVNAFEFNKKDPISHHC